MNRRVLIGVVAGIAVVGLWFVALWKQQQAQIGKAEKRAAAAEQQANDLGLQVSRLQDLKSRTALQQSQLERLRVAIPDQPNLAEFILDANQVVPRRTRSVYSTVGAFISSVTRARIASTDGRWSRKSRAWRFCASLHARTNCRMSSKSAPPFCNLVV